MAIVEHRTCPPLFKDAKSYIEKKLFELDDSFMIPITENERAYINTLETQYEIDNAIWRIMNAFYDSLD